MYLSAQHLRAPLCSWFEFVISRVPQQKVLVGQCLLAQACAKDHRKLLALEAYVELEYQLVLRGLEELARWLANVPPGSILPTTRHAL